MNKKRLVVIFIIILVVALIILGLLKFFEKKSCGYYNFASPYTEDCNCLGKKTGGCPSNALSCDKALTSCSGIRTECFRTYFNQTREAILCK